MTSAELLYWVDEVIDDYIYDDIEDELTEVKTRVHELVEKEQFSCNNWCPRYQRAWRLGYERGIYNATMEDGFSPVYWYALTEEEIKEVNKKIMEKIKHKHSKQGKWIEVEVCNCHATLKCSVCNRVIEPTFTYGEYSYDDIKEWYPYCHCGAQMNGGGEE